MVRIRVGALTEEWGSVWTDDAGRLHYQARRGFARVLREVVAEGREGADVVTGRNLAHVSNDELLRVLCHRLGGHTWAYVEGEGDGGMAAAESNTESDAATGGA